MPMNCLMLFFQTLIIHLHTTTQNEGGGLKQQVILKQTQQFFVLVNLLMVNPLHIVDYIARSAKKSILNDYEDDDLLHTCFH